MIDNLKRTTFLLGEDHKKKLLMLLFLTILNVLIEFVALSLLASFVIILNDPEILIKKINSEFILDYLNRLTNEELIISLTAALFIAFVLKNIFNLGSTYYELNLKKKIIVYNFEKLYSVFLKSKYLYILNKNPSEIVNKLNYIIPKAVDTIFFYFLILKESLITAFLLFLILYADIKIFIFLSGIFGIIMIFFFKYFRKKLDYFSKLKILKETKILQMILETANNFKIIKLLDKDEFFTKNLSKNVDTAHSITIFKNFLDKLPRAFFEISLVTVLLSLMVFLIYQSLDFKLFIPTIVLLCVSFLRLLPSFSNLTAIRTSINFHKYDVKKFLEEIKDVNNVKNEKNSKDITENIDSINLKNMIFKYNDKSKFSLNNVNLSLSKDQIYCFIGKSGSGKSTIVDIITGLIEPDQGQIIINGKYDLSKDHNIKHKVSYVPQNIYLSDTSILENITIGEDEASINKEKFKEAVEFAEISDFIYSLENKEYTKVGDAGKQISGGQKQRIGIARAIYKKNDLLILDEATNALDKNNEDKIMEKLKRIKKNKIVLVIAHSENIIKYCDKIVILENGEILKVVDNQENLNTKDLNIYFDNKEKKIN